ncbi:hypothetical protein QQX98_000992 [Neonectria punicea]|uniref:Heterokaryon incompatibility domain-containing protein n=1 Tax=Neonectria punicea TaxID=979145 RepID=A0ABR1HQT5_9HYPO
MRASKSTIDRIVTFARENGFRMIWIDQECIEQDKPDEKELAIQAMDHVYVRAHTSIGLCHAELQQEGVDCLLLAYESHMGHGFPVRRGRPPVKRHRQVNLEVMRDVLSKIVNDRWNTRAWILQEAFASSKNMILLFPRPSAVDLRGLFRVADKLAIVANMCDYHIRLNTTELEKTQKSLATSILALAALNGDFSLLVPQMYKTPDAATPTFSPKNDSEFTWAHSLAHRTPLLKASQWNPVGAMSMGNVSAGVRLSEQGLSIPGLLWKKGYFIDFKTLQAKYTDSWQRLSTAKGPFAPTSDTIRLANTHLLFEIIQLLVSKGEKQVADSILNSTSNWLWNKTGTSAPGDMIESVDQFPSGLQIENRREMFALDSSPDGRYHQTWLVDRIMKEGGLWAWTLADSLPSPTEPSAEREAEHAPQSHSQMLTTGLTMANIVEGIEAADRSKGENSNPSTLQLTRLPESMAFFAMYITNLPRMNSEVMNRRAVFDVDGGLGEDTMVLTPFQMVLESIPRSPMRSMSVSWVVEATDSVEGNANREDNVPHQRFIAKGMVRGMWTFTFFPSGWYTLV